MVNFNANLQRLMFAGTLVAMVLPVQVSAENEQIELIGGVEKHVQWQVDYSGKPPYKRKRVMVDVVDIAAIEPVETQIVWKRSTGKPPYKRRLVEVPVVDTASLGLVPVEERKVKFRGSPPFRLY